MIKNKRYTTVNTDAGMKRNGAAAFAFWIRSENVVLKGAKSFKTPMKNSNEAELAGILNALHIVAEDEYLRTADVIVVNCDNTQALRVLETNQINGYNKYKDFYKEIKSKISCPIQYRHVKGHSKGKTPREFVNNWCDKELKKHY